MPGSVSMRAGPKISPGSASAWRKASTTRLRREDVHHRIPADRANRRFAGKRLADDRACEGGGRLVGLAGAHQDGRQAKGAAVDEALSAVVVHQKLARRLLRTVGGLGVQEEIVIAGCRHVPAIDRDRAREHDAGRRPQTAAGFEDVAGAVEIDRHAEIEIGLGIGADDRRQVEHGVDVCRDQLVDLSAIGDVAGDAFEVLNQLADLLPPRPRRTGSAAPAAVSARPSSAIPSEASSAAASFLPIKPAPPVITICTNRLRSLFVRRLQAWALAVKGTLRTSINTEERDRQPLPSRNAATSNDHPAWLHRRRFHRRHRPRRHARAVRHAHRAADRRA